MHRRSCSSERNVPETNLAHLGPAIRWRRHASTLARPEPTATQQAGIDDTDKRSDTPGANVLHRHCLASSQERRCEQRPISCVQEMGRCFMARNAMLDTGPLSCLRRFQSGRRTKALDVSPRAGHQMGHGEKRAFLHAQTAKDHGKISLKCILRRARTAKGPLSGKIFAKCIPQHCFSLLFAA